MSCSADPLVITVAPAGAEEAGRTMEVSRG